MHCYTHLILFRLQQFQKKILFGNSSLNDVRIKVEIQLCQVNNSGMGWAGDTVVKELPGTRGSHRAVPGVSPSPSASDLASCKCTPWEAGSSR